jgi:DNA polymerase-3 subunit beta
MSTALLATASEPTRYAINGVLLEASEKGARFVATDGRRLVVCDLQKFEATDEVSAILPERLAALAARMADPKSEEAVALRVKIHPAEGDNVQSQDLSVEGSRWTLSMRQDVGAFPRYRDIFPESHSRFAVQRRPLLDLIKEVAAATDLENTAVRLEMSADTIRVTGRAFDGCESSGTVQAEFLGGGDEHVITGFRPKFLADAISSLPDDRIVIDVQQNSPRSITGTVVQHPAVVRGEDSDGILWVIMPINLGLEPSAATLGSNYTDDDASESTESCSLASAATG